LKSVILFGNLFLIIFDKDAKKLEKEAKKKVDRFKSFLFFTEIKSKVRPNEK